MTGSDGTSVDSAKDLLLLITPCPLNSRSGLGGVNRPFEAASDA